MTTFCRLCAQKSDSFVNIYENDGEELKLASKITWCLKICLFPEDPLPKDVCQSCVRKLDDSFHFLELSTNAQITLQAIFACNNETSNQGNVYRQFLDASHNSKNVLHKEHLDENLSPREDQLGVKEELDSPEDVLECLLENPESRSTTVNSSRRNSSTQRKSNQLSGSAAPPTDKSKTGRVDRQSRRVENQAENCQMNKQDSTSSNRFDEDAESVINEDCSDDKRCSETEETFCERQKQKAPTCSKRKRAEDPEKDDDESKSKSTLEGYTWICVQCDNIFNNVNELRLHYKTVHAQLPIFKCMQCSKTYNRYRSFSRHVQLHRSPKKFSCDICGKTFAQKTILQSHSAVHSDERPFTCDQCGKCFKQFSSLYLHSKNHLPNGLKEKFSCELCEKEFASKHTLETHKKIHTGERNFVCDVCGKSFIAKGSLDYHILTHTGDKPHDCPVCNKGFKTRRLLAKHITLHSGIKPHQCDVCGKQFREKGALREHTRIHTGVMPYACDFCGKKFRFKGILTVHRRQHTGERPYVCLDCPRQFTNWANYNKHMKRKHRNVEGIEHTDPITGKRTFQSHAAAAAQTSNVAFDGGPSFALPGPGVQASNGPPILGEQQHIDTHQRRITENVKIAKPEDEVCEDEDDENSSEEDEEEDIEERTDIAVSDHRLNRQIPANNETGINTMAGPTCYQTIYPNPTHTKMTAVLQSHHSGKMTAMFYQDNSVQHNNATVAMGPYHMSSYMSSGLHAGLSSLPTSLPTGLAAVGNMGYYFPPMQPDHGSEPQNNSIYNIHRQ